MALDRVSALWLQLSLQGEMKGTARGEPLLDARPEPPYEAERIERNNERRKDFHGSTRPESDWAKTRSRL